MKYPTIAVLLSCVYASSAFPIGLLPEVSQDSGLYSYFLEFIETFEKEYESLEEHIERFSIFADNKKFIETHNAAHDDVELGVNQFADMTHEEFKKYIGFRKPEYHVGHLGAGGNLLNRLHSSKTAVEDLPEAVNWVEKGAVTPVKNQGQCGSCYTFSATGAAEGAVFLATGSLPSLSEQELVDCSTDYGNAGCDGGMMDFAFQYMIDQGIGYENEYTYHASQSSCVAANDIHRISMTSYRDVPENDELALQDALAQQPVSIAIHASERSFMFYQSGVYNDAACTSADLDHGVLAVGYGTSEDGKDYWLVKNSWGGDWGEDGYIKIARNEGNRCGVASVASYPVV